MAPERVVLCGGAPGRGLPTRPNPLVLDIFGAQPNVNLVTGVAQARQPAFGDLFGDEDPGHGYPSSLAMRFRPSSRSSSPRAYDSRA